MPSQSWLLNDLSMGEHKTRFAAILDYAKTNHSVTNVVKLVIRNAGFEEVTLRNSSEEEFTGSGEGKDVALANCVATKYPG